MEGLTQPTLLLKPFAQSGTKNTIPVTNTDTSNPQKADLTNGFPAITSQSPDDGGLPPERADFNGLGYLTTTYDYFYQAGGTFTFNQTVATAIGGYPLNSRLWYTDSSGNTTIVRSTKNNNNDNFVTTPSYIGTSWVKDTPTTTDLTNLQTTLTNLISTRVPASIGSGVKPVYTNGNGVITASSSTVGGVAQPVYMNGGNISALTGTVGNGTKPVYLSSGTITVSNSSVGSSSQPVYMSNGTITACTTADIVHLVMPNYSAKFTITSGYTATQNGYVTANATGFCECYLYVNGLRVGGTYTDHNGNSSGFAAVSNGDVITFTGASVTTYFIPCFGG